MKRMFLILLSLILSLSIFTVPAFACDDVVHIYEDDPYGPMTFANSIARYPSFDTFLKMIDCFPSQYTHEPDTDNAVTYTFDYYFIWVSTSDSDSDGYNDYVLYAFDSDITARLRYYENVERFFQDDYYLNDSIAFYYFWDSSTSSWGDVQVMNHATYWTVYEDGGIYWNTDLYDASISDELTVLYPAGKSPWYNSALKSDSSLGYVEADDPDIDNSSSSGTGWLATIVSNFTSLGEKLKENFSNLTESIKGFFEDLQGVFVGWQESLDEWLKEWDVDVYNWIIDVRDTVSTSIDNVEDGLSTFKEEFQNKIEDLKEGISTAISNVKDKISEIGEWLDGFWEGFKSFFVPDDDFMDGVMEHIEHTTDNSSFLTTVSTFVEDLTSFLQQDFSEPPVINVNLSASEGKYNYGFGTVNVFDVSWFKRYRVYTDPFISCILWVVFIWSLAKRLPELLNGAGMIEGTAATAIESRESFRSERERNSYESYKANRDRLEDYKKRYKEDKGDK